ncbi:DUF305 domain-containing protein [Enterovirga sp. CN4-39]|uniref:DUF305 domain-containing protein n=1 Tax=Enterovirga sp. CN4-39 TaxID=3400910 RepID=UPI003C0870A5
MASWWRSPTGINWRAAALLGLVSSTFSTLVSQFTAARLGRDAVVDWMSVAAIPLRDGMIQIEPSGWIIAAGIAFHQWADFSWAIVFFGLLGRWTARLSPWTLIPVALIWALFTSFSEWAFLVPLFPFFQPIFVLEQPYWIGFLVHATSASMYPLFPYLRDWVAGDMPSPNRRFAIGWSSAAAAGVLGLGILALLGSQGRELPWMGADEAYDRGYMRRMIDHHRQGIELARLGAERAQDPHLRMVARLIAAVQIGETEILEQWWRSWFAAPLEVCSPQERAAMPGMLTPDQKESARQADAASFDGRFIALMSHHHAGAIQMADEGLRRAGDIRLRLMSHGIRHGQRGEVQLMHNLQGRAAVRSALAALVLPAGEHPSDRAPAL